MTEVPDSPGSSAIPTAIHWLDSVFLGTLAIMIAVVAVAAVGFLMLNGRIDVRRATQVVLGCFIVFGASTIASGILGAISGTVEGPEGAQSSPPLPPVQLTTPTANPQARTTPFDPYAGAAVRNR